jgi:hypothetical protein
MGRARASNINDSAPAAATAKAEGCKPTTLMIGVTV